MKQEEILKQISSLQDQLNNLSKEVNKPKEDNLIGKCFTPTTGTKDNKFYYIILGKDEAFEINLFKNKYYFCYIRIKKDEIITNKDFEEMPSSTFTDIYKEAIRSISNTIDNALKSNE